MLNKQAKKMKNKVGLPPGSLQYTGDRREGSITVEIFTYDEKEIDVKEYEYKITDPKDLNNINGYEEKERGETEKYSILDIDTLEIEKEKVTWINIYGLNDVGLIEKIGEKFGIHVLVLEDILHTIQRPKFEDMEEYIFMVVKMLGISEEKVKSEQVSVILKDNLIISFQEQKGDVFDGVRERLINSRGKIRKRGADYLFYALLDMIVDNYFLILENYDNRIEQMNIVDVAANPKIGFGEKFQEIRSELNGVKRYVWPLRDAVAAFQKSECGIVTDNTKVYVRDLYDHTLQVIDIVEGLQDSVAIMFEMYMSGVSNKMNEIMKVLTIMSTIFIPMTFIVGVYGMNFRYMPELGYRYAYPLVMIFMFMIFLGLIVFFKKKKWL